MYFKEKKIKGRKYRYAVKSVRLPNGKVKVLGDIAVSEVSESGLLGVAVDQEFSKNNFDQCRQESQTPSA